MLLGFELYKSEIVHCILHVFDLPQNYTYEIQPHFARYTLVLLIGI